MASSHDIPAWKNDAFGVIAFMRFPLIALIVLFHAFNVSVTTPPGALDYHQPVTDLVYWRILHDAFGNVAVPFFFAISGFLYFRSSDFSWAAWKSKTRKRLLRLVLPLLSWSCLAFLLMALFHVLHLPNATAKMYFGSSHSPLWWLDAFIGFQDPMGPRLARASWFIRDLFVVGLLSPIWYPLLKRRLTAALLLVGLFVGYLFWFAPLPFLGSRPMFFFNVGAWYAIVQRDFLADAHRVAIPCFVLWLVSTILLLWRPDMPAASILGHCRPCFLIPPVLALSSAASKRVRIPALLSAASFFVYFGHASLWIRIPWHTALLKVFAPFSDGAVLLFILLNAAGEIAICVLLYAALKRFFPCALIFLVGEHLPRKQTPRQ